jgi:hypothetical protein
MEASDLTVEQEAEAQRIADIVVGRTRLEVLQMARLLATRKNSEFFGQTEFAIRDAVHRIGAVTIETALEERKKRGIKEAASPAPSAVTMRNSKGTNRKRSSR